MRKRRKSDLKMTRTQAAEAVNALAKLVEKSNTQTEFSKTIDTHQSQVSRWLSGTTIPFESALRIEKEFGVSREILRPDLFRRKV